MAQKKDVFHRLSNASHICSSNKSEQIQMQCLENVSVCGRNIFHLRFKVTLQTFGIGLFSPWSCHYWLTVSPKNSPSFSWFSTTSSNPIQNSFQTVCVTLSNTRLLQDVESLKVNISWIKWALRDSFTCLPAWLLYILLVRFSSHSCVDQLHSTVHQQSLTTPLSLHLILELQPFFT